MKATDTIILDKEQISHKIRRIAYQVYANCGGHLAHQSDLVPGDYRQEEPDESNNHDIGCERLQEQIGPIGR